MVDNIQLKSSNISNENRIKRDVKIKSPTLSATNTNAVSKPAFDNKSNELIKKDNLNTQSVYDKFLQILNSSPMLSETIRKILLNQQFININIKNDPIINKLFDSFIDEINMNEQQLVEFIKSQCSTLSIFRGDFFKELRQLLANDNSPEFKTLVSNFLKSYDSFISNEQIMQSINSTLKSIEHNLPKPLRETFESIINNLIYDKSANSTDINLKTLKSDILPFLGKYISKMNDFGIIRDYVSVLIHNIVRLENGEMDNFSLNIDNLFNYMSHSLSLDEDKITQLKNLLIKSFNEGSSPTNKVLDKFFKLLDAGVNKSSSVINQGTFESINNALLLNKSVFIPILHMFIPLQFNNSLMFSELWINRETEHNTNNSYEKIERYTVFVNFEINILGYFEATMTLQDKDIKLDLKIPDNLKSFSKKIQSDLETILENKSLEVSSVTVSSLTKKRKFFEVFNISERKNSVNVII